MVDGPCQCLIFTNTFVKKIRSSAARMFRQPPARILLSAVAPGFFRQSQPAKHLFLEILIANGQDLSDPCLTEKQDQKKADRTKPAYCHGLWRLRRNPPHGVDSHCHGLQHGCLLKAHTVRQRNQICRGNRCVFRKTAICTGTQIAVMPAHLILLFPAGDTVHAGNQREYAYPPADPSVIHVPASLCHNAGKFMSRDQRK